MSIHSSLPSSDSCKSPSTFSAVYINIIPSVLSFQNEIPLSFGSFNSRPVSSLNSLNKHSVGVSPASIFPPIGAYTCLLAYL